VYVDHGACRGVFTKIEDLAKLLEDKYWAILSTLPYIIESEYEREKLSQKIVDIWLKITSSTRFVEDIYVTVRWFKINELSVSDLARKIIKILSEVNHYLEDIVLMNIFLKVETGLALPDIGLVVVYENPLLVEQGIRQRPIPITRAVLRRSAKVVYESKLARRVKELELEYVILRNVGSDKPVIVDWSCLGVYPYSSQTQSIVNEQEVADPVLVTYLTHKVKVRTTVSKMPSIIQHYREVREVLSSLKYYLARARDLVEKQIIVLPTTMTQTHVSTVVGFLRSLGVEVVDIVSVPVDLIVSAAQSSL